MESKLENKIIGCEQNVLNFKKCEEKNKTNDKIKLTIFIIVLLFFVCLRDSFFLCLSYILFILYCLISSNSKISSKIKFTILFLLLCYFLGFILGLNLHSVCFIFFLVASSLNPM